MSGSIARFLRDDHARLDALLARSAADPGSIDEEAYAQFRVGLLGHIGMEEKILLPAAKRLRGGVALETAKRLRDDHGRIAALLCRRPTHGVVAELRAILVPHNVIEEEPGGVYETCEALAGAEAARILNELLAMPAVPAAPYYEGPIRSRAHGGPTTDRPRAPGKPRGSGGSSQ